MTTPQKDNYKKIISFILLTFLISWVSWGILIIVDKFGLNNNIHTFLWMLGGFGPTGAVIILLIKWKIINNTIDFLNISFIQIK
jgi:hypothetical protein